MKLTEKEAKKVRLLARLSSKVLVTLEDVADIGACGMGVSEWCKSKGLDPTNGIPISTLANDPDRTAQMIALRVARRVLYGR